MDDPADSPSGGADQSLQLRFTYVLAALAGSTVLAACSHTIGGHGAVRTSDELYPTYLSHTAVEHFIVGSSQLGSPPGVICNGGKDFRMQRAGETFSCASRDGRDYTVTITDPTMGAYTVK